MELQPSSWPTPGMHTANANIPWKVLTQLLPDSSTPQGMYNCGNAGNGWCYWVTTFNMDFNELSGGFER